MFENSYLKKSITKTFEFPIYGMSYHLTRFAQIVTGTPAI